MNLPTSNYFTVVIYPNEIEKNTINSLYQLGTIYFSPIHFHQAENVKIGDFAPSQFKERKAHQHLLIKSCNKITENSFIMRLCDILNNDFTGLSLHKGDCLVKKPEQMIRYFYHLDNPTKEHFDLEDAFEDVPINFTNEVVNAFNNEITLRVSFAIQADEIENIQQLIGFYANSAILTKWLFTGRNMYVVNSMFNEKRRNSIYERTKTN